MKIAQLGFKLQNKTEIIQVVKEFENEKLYIVLFYDSRYKLFVIGYISKEELLSKKKEYLLFGGTFRSKKAAIKKIKNMLNSNNNIS